MLSKGPHTEIVHPHSSLTAAVTSILGYRKLKSRHIEVLKARPTSIGRVNTQIHQPQIRGSFISQSQFSNIRVHHWGSLAALRRLLRQRLLESVTDIYEWAKQPLVSARFLLWSNKVVPETTLMGSGLVSILFLQLVLPGQLDQNWGTPRSVLGPR